jgi:hypothetical protein
MKSTVRLSITADGELCRDTDAGATRLLAPVGEDVPSEFLHAYEEKFGAGAPEAKDAAVPTFVHEIEVGKLEVFEGGAVKFQGKALAKCSKVDLATVATILEVENAAELTKDGLVDAVSSATTKLAEAGDAS